MSAPQPLPVYPYPLSEQRMALLKAAKAAIDTDAQVFVAPAEAGSPGRILAFGEAAPIVAEQVLIRPENADNLESIKAALEFWLTGGAEPPSLTEEDMLSHFMQCEVRLVSEELIDAPVVPDTIRRY